jgi:glycerol-3-phosphate cytidylyltransferase-like family protein
MKEHWHFLHFGESSKNIHFHNYIFNRQVSKVIIGVPRCINADFIQRFGIDLVARGKKARFNNCQRGIDCMAVTQEMGILRELDSGSTVTTQTVSLKWPKETK